MTEERKNILNSHPLQASHRIAREARRRIELVASRMPRPRTRLRPGEAPPVDRVVVISDTHFGDAFDVLTSKHLIEALVECLEGLGDIDELVLLGDVFDFWKAPIDEAMSRGKGFMSALFTLKNVGRMVYMPGNHDHHVFRLYYQEQVTNRLRAGELELPELSMPLTTDCPTMEALRPKGARVPLFAVYPTYQVSVRGRQALLTHGQLLGFFERSLWAPRHSRVSSLFLKRTESLDLEDMEMFVSPFYELLTLSALVPGVPNGGYRVYRLLSRTGKALGLQGASRESANRGTTIEENVAEIEALLDYFCPEKPDYFVYGHTHRAGILALPLSGTIAINTGCWLADEVPENAKNTILEITDDARLIRVEV
ncbi:MAG: metallophosphoesterase [Actinomycetia bacterium]|nr:metallophosphoesterase [Actinomycetota bacterium]MCG2795113.1 metallophosphoesterase [Actinomycetes bacterium]